MKFPVVGGLGGLMGIIVLSLGWAAGQQGSSHAIAPRDISAKRPKVGVRPLRPLLPLRVKLLLKPRASTRSLLSS